MSKIAKKRYLTITDRSDTLIAVETVHGDVYVIAEKREHYVSSGPEELVRLANIGLQVERDAEAGA